METNKTNNGTDGEKATLAVYQLAEEVKDLNKSIVDIVNTVNHLSGRMSKFDERLSKINTEPPPFDMKKVEVLLAKCLADMSAKIEGEIKQSRRTYQFLLFPPQDAKLFYKIVFGRWLLYLVIAFGIFKIYEWAVHESNNRAQVEMEDLRFKNEKITKAWNYMYDLKNKNLHRQMDSALVKSAR